MEKVLYVIAHPVGSVPADLTKHLAGPLADELLDLGAKGVQVNVADHDVSAAGGLRMTMSPSPANALVAVWVDTAIDHRRVPFDDAVRAAAPEAELSAYLVTESVPLEGADQAPAPGERWPGMAQLAFLRRPDAMAVDDWLEVWLEHHTHVALELQQTFAYVQNVIVRTLIPGATAWHAIVEECFPAAAMSDPHVFFDAIGDDEKLARHQRQMFESVQRFIDLSIIDVVPTSRYVL